MPIKDIDEFASTGTKTIPSDSEKARGWVGGEQVAGDHHNWWQNQITNKLNESIAQGVDTVYPDGDSARDVVATKLWATEVTPWGICDDVINTLDIGAKAICDLEVYYPSYAADQDPYLMILERATDSNEIFVYNARTKASIDSSGTLGGLDSGSGQTYDAVDFCTDGTNVYVLFWDSQGGARDCYVQKYDIATWTPQWGAGLIGIPCIATASTYPTNSQIIMANDAYVGLTIEGTDINSYNPFIILAIADGTRKAGYGDFGKGASDVGTGAIASDGTNLFVGIYDHAPSTQNIVASATIAGLISGAGGGLAGFSYSGDGDVGLTNLICPATDVLVSFWNASSSGKIVQAGLTSDPEALDLTSSADIESPVSLYDVTFDGLNFFILGRAITGGDAFRAVYKFPASCLILEDSGGALTAVDFSTVSSYFLVNPRESGGLATSDKGNLTFDGRDIWTAPEPDAGGATLEGQLFRLPRANNR